MQLHCGSGYSRVSGSVPVVTDGIIDPVSSRRARRRRRQAAQVRHYKRLRKAGRVPQHTRAERRRAAAERARQREADEQRKTRLRRVLPPLAVGAGVPALVFLGPGAAAGVGVHHWYPMVSSGSPGGLALPAPDDLPEPGMTYYTPIIAAGTAVTFAVQVYGDLWWRSWYPPDLTGD